jgi:hypothetical protein
MTKINKCSEMDLNDLFELEQIANDLVAETDPTATLIFVGQSPAYIRIAIGNRRKTIQVAFSKIYSSESVSKEKLNKYRQYLESIGITKDLFDSDPAIQNKYLVASQDISTHHVIFIEFIDTGQGINSFASLLKDCFGQNVIPIKVLAIWAQEENFDVNDVPNLTIIGQLQISRNLLFKMTDEEYPRTVAHYSSKNWDSPPFLENKKGKDCEQKLEQYEELHQEMINACSNFAEMSLHELNEYIELLKVNAAPNVLGLLDDVVSNLPLNELCQKLSIVETYLRNEYLIKLPLENKQIVSKGRYLNDYNYERSPPVPRDEQSFERLNLAIDQINTLPNMKAGSRKEKEEFLVPILKAVIGARITVHDARYLINKLKSRPKTEIRLLENIVFSHVIDKYNLNMQDEVESKYKSRPSELFNPNIHLGENFSNNKVNKLLRKAKNF